MSDIDYPLFPRTRERGEAILEIFAEAQAPWQSALIDEVIRTRGCQRLKDTVAKQRWSAANKDKQKAYSAESYKRNAAAVQARARARRLKKKLEATSQVVA